MIGRILSMDGPSPPFALLIFCALVGRHFIFTAVSSVAFGATSHALGQTRQRSLPKSVSVH